MTVFQLNNAFADKTAAEVSSRFNTLVSISHALRAFRMRSPVVWAGDLSKILKTIMRFTVPKAVSIEQKSTIFQRASFQ